MPVQLRHLRYFVRIVDAGSFSRAASVVHIAQPALSQQIAELEQELGVPLLHRSARGVRPTPAGEVLYREAISILGRMEQLPDLIRSSTQEIEGTVAVGVASVFGSAIVAQFLERCRATLPKVTVRYVTSGGSVTLRERIEAHTLHLAFTYEDEPSPTCARQALYRQSFFLIGREPLPGNPTSVSLHELTALPLVLPTAPNVARAKLDKTFAEAGLAPHIVSEADMNASVMAAVQAGIGGTVLPKGDFSDVPGCGKLIATAIEPPIELTAVILWSADGALTPAATAVRDLLHNFIEERVLSPLPPGAERIADG